MTSKISYRELLIFSQLAKQWTTKHPEQTKLKYAIERVLAPVAKLEAQIQEELSGIDLDHCATEKETGIVLVDAGGAFKFEKEELKKRNAARAKFFDDRKWALESFLVKVIPAGLTEFELRTFAGWVLDPAVVAAELERREAEAMLEEETDAPAPAPGVDPAAAEATQAT